MPIATGIDVISISRIKNAALSKRFLERVFTESELDYSFKKRLPYKHLAGRFAAKEACLKAFTSGLSKGLNLKDIEIVNGEGGRPALRLRSKAEGLLGDGKIFLSIAYSKDTALAFVAIER